MTKIVEKIIWVGDGKRENKLWYEDLLITYNDGTYEKIRINLNKYVYMTTLNQRFKTFFDIKQLKNKTMTNVKKELNNLSKKWRTLQKEEDKARHKETEG